MGALNLADLTWLRDICRVTCKEPPGVVRVRNFSIESIESYWVAHPDFGNCRLHYEPDVNRYRFMPPDSNSLLTPAEVAKLLQEHFCSQIPKL